MSYDVYFTVPTGGTESVDIGCRNYTSNCSGMWSKALALPEKPTMRDGQQVIGSRPIRDAEGNSTGEWERVPIFDRGLRLLDEAPASEAAGVLQAAVERMAANPDEYTPMNPANGWGDYDSALDFLRWIADMASAHPAATIRVSS